jgi:hypothetical protein
MGDIHDRWGNNTRFNTKQKMTDKKVKPSLFQAVVEKVGEVSKEQKLTLPYILGELELVKKHVTDSVLANLSKAAEQISDGDKVEKTDADPAEDEDKA